jgi:outer membrane protein OmpA-like peptidoglycan-associated protein
MTMLRKSLVWGFGIPIALALATSGCASKKYVSQQVAPVNQRVAKLEKTTNEKIAAVWSKHESDISQVNERISTTDQRVAQVASATQQAQGTASRALQTADENSIKIADNSSSIAANTGSINALGTGVANALNYQLVEKADVTFAFNKATLTPEAKLALDQVASKAAGLPRSVVELAGFTDPVGSKNYNLALSRRRAEAVQRYLVMRKVPLHTIHLVGLGEEAPPEGLTAELAGPNPSQAELHRLARRVHIRLFGAGDIQGSASRDR